MVIEGNDFLDDRWTAPAHKVLKDAERLAERRRIYEASRMFVISCDLGRQHDASVICGLEGTSEDVAVRNVEVFNRTDYNALSDRLLVIRERLPDALLVFDATGVGLGVLDLFLTRGVNPDLAVVITSGNKAHSGKDMTGTSRLSMPKAELIAYITRLLNQGAIQMGGTTPGFELLNKEIKQFTATVRKTGTIAYEAPTGQHDDTVLSLAVGVAGYSWLASRRNNRAAQQHQW